MRKGSRCCLVWICLLFSFWAGVVVGQDADSDAVIDAIRSRNDIGESDQRRIAEWIQARVDEFADHKSLTERLIGCFVHSGNTETFRAQFSAQTAQVAAAQFARSSLDRNLAQSLARVLLDMNRSETFPGLLAGLKSSDASARCLCARGLVAQRRSLAADSARLRQMIAGLGEAGIAEDDPVVLGRIYEALAVRDHAAEVFDTYMRLFDERLQRRRGAATRTDGAEIHAYEYFRSAEVINSLDQNQRVELARRVAVFLRFDAQRYNDPAVAPPSDSELPDLNFDERDRIERMLDAGEEILESITGAGRGGKIRNKLSNGGYAERRAVLREAYRWIGDPQANESGVLNEAPWNVPLGAP